MSANIDPNIELPVLLITENRDVVAAAAVMEKGIRQFAEDVLAEESDGGHGLQFEFKDEANKVWEDFISGVEMRQV